MTDRVNYISVVVPENLREDDALQLIAAIGLLKGVVSVGYSVADIDSFVATSRARSELSAKVMNAVIEALK